MQRTSGSAQKPLVSIVTATIIGREHLLSECVASVEAQTFRAYEHREGCSTMCNRMVAEAQGEWLFLLADDDLALPGCLASHVAHSADADIVYSPPLVTGNEDRFWFFQAPPVLPATALIRKQLWLDLGGYAEAASREEDRKLWIKAVETGARFVRTTDPCWVYRQHDSNKSFAA
jgi:hypothetical protein